MNIICSTVEAVTVTTQLIGTAVGNLSVMWSWASGLYHMVAGPLIGGGCGTVSALCQDIIGGFSPGKILHALGVK